jgi:hypothetical protein
MKPKTSITAVLVCSAAQIIAAGQVPVKKDSEPITVAGCVQKEADYRKANDKGRAGVAGTGIGADNEFVLINVKTTTAGGPAYELTGANEKLAAAHVGHRVEITGTLKPGEAGASGATGGATAGKPPKGVDVVSKDLRLRELEVASVKMIAATCSTR